MRNRCLRLGAPIRAWGSTYLQWRHLAAEKAKVNFRVKKGRHINESWGLFLGHDNSIEKIHLMHLTSRVTQIGS